MKLRLKSYTLVTNRNSGPRLRGAAAVAAIALAWTVTGCGSTSTPSESTGTASAAGASTEQATSDESLATTRGGAADPAMLQGPLPTSAIGQPTAARLQAALDDTVAGGVPDAIAAVITPNGTWAGAAGVDGPNGQLATAADEFAIASISKTFTAAMIMRLADEGKIDLHQPLASYLGEGGAVANDATVEQALAMRGGFGDTASAVFDEVYADPGHAWTPAEVVSKIGPPLGPAGEEFHNSNPGYKLLGIAAEHATGAARDCHGRRRVGSCRRDRDRDAGPRSSAVSTVGSSVEGLRRSPRPGRLRPRRCAPLLVGRDVLPQCGRNGQ